MTLVPPKGPSSITTPGIKPMRPTDWMCGVTVTPGKAFVLTPSTAAAAELAAFLRSAARAPVCVRPRERPVQMNPLRARARSFSCALRVVRASPLSLNSLLSRSRSRSSPRRDDGGPHAPAKSALELGEENSSFKVFVRCRPFLAREAAAASVIKVEDVAGFPREPPPQRITLGASAAFVFDRVFEPGTQAEICEQAVRPLVDTVRA